MTYEQPVQLFEYYQRSRVEAVISGSTMKKISMNSTTKPPQKMTSTPTRSSANTFAEPYLNVSNISCASICTSESDRMSSKRAVSKEVSTSQDELEYAHNVYLLALATTKLQEKSLSEVTPENENQKLTLLCEVERKRSHLAALKKRYEEVKHLSEQSQLLSREKEKLGSLMDFVSDGLKKVDPLKNTLDCGLPVTGFQAEPTDCSLKNTICESNKMLEELCESVREHGPLYSKTGQEVADIQSTVTSIAEAQNRCGNISADLSHAVLKENALKITKQRNTK